MTAADDLRKHAVEYPVWGAPPEAIGCGRRVPGVPPTPAQVAYEEAYLTYVRERLAPWTHRKAELEAAVEAERQAALEPTLW